MATPFPTMFGRPRRYIPALAPVLDRLEPYAYSLVRFTCGALLVPHGWMKLFEGGLPGTVGGFSKLGLEPAYPLAVYIALLELVGGAMIALGFLTRLFAVQVVGFMAVATFWAHWSNGYVWNKGGYEMPLFWMLIAIAVCFGGSGRLSVDRALGKEL